MIRVVMLISFLGMAGPLWAEEACDVTELGAATCGEAIKPGDALPDDPALIAEIHERIRTDVARCWNVRSLSAEAMRPSVTISFQLTRDGRPVASALQLISNTGGSDAAAQQAYEAARRAVLRCGASGYDLPIESFHQWQTIEMTFISDEMRLL